MPLAFVSEKIIFELAAKAKEIYELLRVANRAPEVRALYAREFSTPADLSWDQTASWYSQQVKFWAEQSKKVKTPNK